MKANKFEGGPRWTVAEELQKKLNSKRRKLEELEEKLNAINAEIEKGWNKKARKELRKRKKAIEQSIQLTREEIDELQRVMDVDLRGEEENNERELFEERGKDFTYMQGVESADLIGQVVEESITPSEEKEKESRKKEERDEKPLKEEAKFEDQKEPESEENVFRNLKQLLEQNRTKFAKEIVNILSLRKRGEANDLQWEAEREKVVAGSAEDAVDNFMISREKGKNVVRIEIRTLKGRNYIVEIDFENRNITLNETERKDKRYINMLVRSLRKEYRERGRLIREKKASEDNTEIKEIEMKLWRVNSMIENLYEKLTNLKAEGIKFPEKEEKMIDEIGKIIERERIKKSERSIPFVAGIENGNLVDQVIRSSGGFREAPSKKREKRDTQKREQEQKQELREEKGEGQTEGFRYFSVSREDLETIKLLQGEGGEGGYQKAIAKLAKIVNNKDIVPFYYNTLDLRERGESLVKFSLLLSGRRVDVEVDFSRFEEGKIGVKSEVVKSKETKKAEVKAPEILDEEEIKKMRLDQIEAKIKEVDDYLGYLWNKAEESVEMIRGEERRKLQEEYREYYSYRQVLRAEKEKKESEEKSEKEEKTAPEILTDEEIEKLKKEELTLRIKEVQDYLQDVGPYPSEREISEEVKEYVRYLDKLKKEQERRQEVKEEATAEAEYPKTKVETEILPKDIEEMLKKIRERERKMVGEKEELPDEIKKLEARFFQGEELSEEEVEKVKESIIVESATNGAIISRMTAELASLSSIDDFVTKRRMMSRILKETQVMHMKMRLELLKMEIDAKKREEVEKLSESKKQAVKKFSFNIGKVKDMLGGVRKVFSYKEEVDKETREGKEDLDDIEGRLNEIKEKMRGGIAPAAEGERKIIALFWGKGAEEGKVKDWLEILREKNAKENDNLRREIEEYKAELEKIMKEKDKIIMKKEDGGKIELDLQEIHSLLQDLDRKREELFEKEWKEKDTKKQKEEGREKKRREGFRYFSVPKEKLEKIKLLQDKKKGYEDSSITKEALNALRSIVGGNAIPSSYDDDNLYIVLPEGQSLVKLFFFNQEEGGWKETNVEVDFIHLEEGEIGAKSKTRKVEEEEIREVSKIKAEAPGIREEEEIDTMNAEEVENEIKKVNNYLSYLAEKINTAEKRFVKWQLRTEERRYTSYKEGLEDKGKKKLEEERLKEESWKEKLRKNNPDEDIEEIRAKTIEGKEICYFGYVRLKDGRTVPFFNNVLFREIEGKKVIDVDVNTLLYDEANGELEAKVKLNDEKLYKVRWNKEGKVIKKERVESKREEVGRKVEGLKEKGEKIFRRVKDKIRLGKEMKEILKKKKDAEN